MPSNKFCCIDKSAVQKRSKSLHDTGLKAHYFEPDLKICRSFIHIKSGMEWLKEEEVQRREEHGYTPLSTIPKKPPELPENKFHGEGFGCYAFLHICIYAKNAFMGLTCSSAGIFDLQTPNRLELNLKGWLLETRGLPLLILFQNTPPQLATGITSFVAPAAVYVSIASCLRLLFIFYPLTS